MDLQVAEHVAAAVLEQLSESTPAAFPFFAPVPGVLHTSLGRGTYPSRFASTIKLRGQPVEDRHSEQAWIVADPDGKLRMVAPADRATAAEREISDGWRQMAADGDFELLVSWVLHVGEKHGWPLDEAWVRHTFAELTSVT